MDQTDHDPVEPAPNDPLGPPLPRFMLGGGRGGASGVARLWGGSRKQNGDGEGRAGASVLPLTPRVLTMLIGGLGLAGSFLFAAGMLLGLNLQIEAETKRAGMIDRHAAHKTESAGAVQTAVAARDPAPVAPQVSTTPPPPPADTGASLVQAASAAPLPGPTASEMTILQASDAHEKVDAPPPAPPMPETISPPVRIHERPQHAIVTSEGRYTVQVGAFRNADNARAMERRLLSAGFPVGVTPFSNRKGDALYRVHVGRFANPGKAGPIREAVKSRGIDAIVVRIN